MHIIVATRAATLPAAPFASPFIFSASVEHASLFVEWLNEHAEFWREGPRVRQFGRAEFVVSVAGDLAGLTKLRDVLDPSLHKYVTIRPLGIVPPHTNPLPS